LPAALLMPGSVETVSVAIGTYMGAANGVLSVTACAGDACRSGSAELASAADGTLLPIDLDAPLPIAREQELRLRFTHAGGTTPVVIWQQPQATGTMRLPELAISYAFAGMPVRRVYVDRRMTIYELANAAPYFETVGGPCQISAVGRETVTTDCASPARLIRRELFFDGWRATIDGRGVPIVPAPPIVQAVDVPSGVARIEFHYAPPFADASTVAFVVALLLLAIGAVRPLPLKWQ